MLAVAIVLFLLLQYPILIFVDHTHKLALENYTLAHNLERRVNEQIIHTEEIVKRVQQNG